MTLYLTIGPIILISAFFAYLFIRSRLSAGSSKTFDNTILKIKVPKGEEKRYELQSAPVAAEQMFATLHGMLKETPSLQEHIAFEMTSDESGILFYCAVPKEMKSFVEGQIYSQYPQAQIGEVEDYSNLSGTESLSGKVVSEVYITLEKDDYKPIRNFRDFEVDPLAAVTGALSEVNEGEKIFFQLLIRPLADIWQQAGYDYVTMVREGKQPVKFEFFEIFRLMLSEGLLMLGRIPKKMTSPGPEDIRAIEKAAEKGPIRLSAGQEIELKTIEEKLAKLGFEVGIRVLAVAKSEDTTKRLLTSVTSSFKQYSIANLNSFIKKEFHSGEEALREYNKRAFPDYESFILTTEELASIFHLPSATVETPTISWSLAKRGEPPLDLPVENVNYIGHTTFRDKMVKFGIKDEDRTKHFYLVGKTGTGKSTLFKNMIVQDMKKGNGVGILDPHGDLVDELLDFVPDNRVKDVVIFDPSDTQRPVSLNLLENPDPRQKNLMASGLVGAVKKHFEYSWGPRLEYLLNNAILTLLEVPNTSMLGITRLLSDINYQKYIVHKIKDPVIKDFWEKEYREMKGNQRLITEAVAPIQNKIGRFLASTTIRNILGQPKSTIDIEDIMNNRKLLFVNLSKGKIGEDNANLLGSLLVSRLNFMSMRRVHVPERQRIPFYFYVDEFQNFASGSFANILSEARKYKLALHLTHQYTAQLPEEMMDAVFGNIGTISSFSLGAPDAAVLAPEFAPIFEENDLISLERHHMYVKLMIDGMTSPPFSAVSLLPPTETTGNRELCYKRSREKFGNDGKLVEKRIGRWVERQFNLGLAIAEKNGEEGVLEGGEVIHEGGEPDIKSLKKREGEFVIKQK